MREKKKKSYIIGVWSTSLQGWYPTPNDNSIFASSTFVLLIFTGHGIGCINKEQPISDMELEVPANSSARKWFRTLLSGLYSNL